MGFPCSSVGKNPPASAGNVGSFPGSGISAGEGNGNPLQYSCLGNPMDRGAWRAIVHGFAKEFGHDLATKHDDDTSASSPALRVQVNALGRPGGTYCSDLSSKGSPI